MTKILRGKLIPISTEDIERTTAFFSSMGMTFHSGLYDPKIERIFLIELKYYPEILVKLEAAGYFSKQKGETGNIWDILSITEKGVSLYLVGPGITGDDYLFIPMENIIAIHEFDEKDVAIIANHTENNT